MGLLNKFPVVFFEQARSDTPKKKNDILSIKWSKKVLEKEKKAVVSLAKKRK